MKDFFVRYPGTLQPLQVRGGETQECWLSSARLKVKAHRAKRFVIALKNKDEAGYRSLVATDPGESHQANNSIVVISTLSD